MNPVKAIITGLWYESKTEILESYNPGLEEVVKKINQFPGFTDKDPERDLEHELLSLTAH